MPHDFSIAAAHFTLGVLGGHSALASSCFHARLLERLRQAGCAQDIDYPRIAHWSTPLAGLDDAGLARGEGARSLTHALKSLESFEPAFVAVTCNSLATLVDDCRASSAAAQVAFTPVHAVNRRVIAGRALVLAAGNARRYQMVQPQADEVAYPGDEDQTWVLNVTQAVRSQGALPALRAQLEQRIVQWHSQGYAKVVLACTELSALVPDSVEPGQGEVAAFYVDAMACLLDDAVTAWTQRRA